MDLATVLAGTDTLSALDDARDAAWRATNTDLLALCRDRMAMVLDHRPTLDAMSDTDRAELAEWRQASRFAPLERAALDVTEQYLFDVASLSDERVAALREPLGDAGLVDFVNALLVVEQRMRLELAFEVVL